MTPDLMNTEPVVLLVLAVALWITLAILARRTP